MRPSGHRTTLISALAVSLSGHTLVLFSVVLFVVMLSVCMFQRGSSGFRGGSWASLGGGIVVIIGSFSLVTVSAGDCRL